MSSETGAPVPAATSVSLNARTYTREQFLSLLGASSDEQYHAIKFTGSDVTLITIGSIAADRQ